jgi:glycosyltransferase involved in cell wall biosynthesis
MLTVLLATRNRANILREVLEAYSKLQVPESGWKLVVIDNGSTDRTQEVLASMAKELPLVSIVEPRPGKNFALNTGLDHAEGDLIVLTDDDAFPAKDWLISLRKAADERPEFAMFGGLVSARWETPPPSWVRWVKVGPVYTISDSSLVEGPIEPYHIFGPNMAVRAAVFEKGIRFDTTIGPTSSSYAMGSETELVLRLSEQGYRGWFVEGAMVEHFIRKEQLEIEWVLRRGVRYGRGHYRLFGLKQDAGKRSRIAVTLQFAYLALRQAARVAVSFLSRNEEALFLARWRLSFLLGQMEEARLGRDSRASKKADYVLAGTKERPRGL